MGRTDANIPRLAMQAANELAEFIEGRKPTADSARHLADVLKKTFHLQPIAAAGAVTSVADADAGAVFTHAMSERPSDTKASTRVDGWALRDRLLDRLVPIGYQDETGFYRGVELRRRAPIPGNVQPPTAPPA
jgi:hypothetical protein